MAEDPIDSVARHLRITGVRRDQVIRELNSHLEASRHDLELGGATPEEATRETIRRFGDPAEVAALLTEVHRRRLPRLQSMMVTLVALTAISAWLGTSHTFASSGHTPAHKPVPAHTRCVRDQHPTGTAMRVRHSGAHCRR